MKKKLGSKNIEPSIEKWNIVRKKKSFRINKQAMSMVDFVFEPPEVEEFWKVLSKKDDTY